MDEYLTVGGCNYKICSQWFDKWLISKNFWFFIPLYIVYLSIPLFSAVEEENVNPCLCTLAWLGFAKCFNSFSC